MRISFSTNQTGVERSQSQQYDGFVTDFNVGKWVTKPSKNRGRHSSNSPRLLWPLSKAHKNVALRALVVGFVVLTSAYCNPSTNKPSLLSPCRKPSDDLHVAAAEGDSKAIEALVDRGTAVDEVDELGWTALHWAAEAGRVEAVASLLDRAADPNASDGIGMTPLHWAAMLGRAEVVELLLSRGARVDSRNRYGMTPLHYAANRHVVDALIGGGADVRAIDGQGRSPLHTVRNGEVARALLEAGADVRIRAAHGRTAFESMVVDEIKEKGLVFIFENSTIRLRGDRVRFSVAALNVSICEIRELALVVRSPAAWALVRPRKLSRLAPGEMKNIAIDFDRRPEAAEAKHPVDIQIALGRTGAGDLKLNIDTRKRELPTDRGIIRLGKGVLRPASRPGVKYLPFLAIPLILIAYWFWRRFRKH